MLDAEFYAKRGLKPVFIYGLTDPESGDIRYIGKSIRPNERLRNHINEKPSNCHRSHWIQSLRSKGLEPGMVLIEEIVGAWPWQRSEQYWIAYGLINGWKLTNNTAGGDGVTGLSEAAREKIASTWRGRKHTPASIERIRQAKTGSRHSDETKARMSVSHKCRKITWGAKIAKARQKLSDEDQTEIILALSRKEKVKELSIRFGVHRTTISKVKNGTYNVD